MGKTGVHVTGAEGAPIQGADPRAELKTIIDDLAARVESESSGDVH